MRALAVTAGVDGGCEVINGIASLGFDTAEGVCIWRFEMSDKVRQSWQPIWRVPVGD